MEYYTAITMEVLPFATTWRELEGIVLSQISLTKTDNYHDFTHVWNLRKKKNKKQTHSQSKPEGKELYNDG